MVMTDIFGRYIRVENVDVGGESDKTMHIGCDVCTDPDRFLSQGEIGLADMGYAYCPRVEVSDKKNQSLAFPLREKRNKAIRGVRHVNEWAKRYINKRYRLFLGRWIFSDELYAMAF